MGRVSPSQRAARYALRLLMQHISQEVWVSVWRRDLEFLLWAAIAPARRDPPWPLSREQAATLAWLAEEAGGWYYWAPDEIAVIFIERTAWEPLYRAWRRQQPEQADQPASPPPF